MEKAEEPMLEYGLEQDFEENGVILSPLTEEDLKDTITGEELLEHLYAHIDKLFNQK